MDLDQLPVADARIARVVIEPGRIEVRLRDWQERPISIVFGEVVRVESQDWIGLDLSHIEVSSVVPPLGDGPATAIRRFDFASAWATEAPVLRVFAGNFAVHRDKRVG